jgi:hypothetical protein
MGLAYVRFPANAATFLG